MPNRATLLRCLPSGVLNSVSLVSSGFSGLLTMSDLELHFRSLLGVVEDTGVFRGLIKSRLRRPFSLVSLGEPLDFLSSLEADGVRFRESNGANLSLQGLRKSRLRPTTALVLELLRLRSLLGDANSGILKGDLMVISLSSV